MNATIPSTLASCVPARFPVLDSDSILSVKAYSLPSNTTVTWSRWSASDLVINRTDNATDNAISNSATQQHCKGKESDASQDVATDIQNQETLSTGEDTSRREGGKEQQADEAVDNQMPRAEAQDQYILASSWRSLNRWQKLQRSAQFLESNSDNTVDGLKQCQDPIKELLQPTLYLLQSQRSCTPGTTTSHSPTSTATMRNNSRASLPPKVHGKRKNRGGDVAEKIQGHSSPSPVEDQDSSEGQHETDPTKLKATVRKTSEKGDIECIWSFNITWDEDENGNHAQARSFHPDSAPSKDQSQPANLSEADRERSSALEALKSLRNFTTGSYTLNTVYRDPFRSNSALSSIESIFPTPHAKEPNSWLMKALALRSADDLAYSRCAHQARQSLQPQVEKENVQASSGTKRVDPQDRDSGIKEESRHAEKQSDEDGEEGEWNESESPEATENGKQSDSQDVSLRISDRRIVRMGEGIVLLPRATDRPSRAPPPTSLRPDHRAITHASFRCYTDSNFLISQLFPGRKALSAIDSLSDLETGTQLTLAPFEQLADFSCTLSSLSLNLGSSCRLPSSESEPAPGTGSGDGPGSWVSGAPALRALGDLLRPELDQAGIYGNGRYLDQEEWIVCRIESKESGSPSQEKTDVSAVSLRSENAETLFLWPHKLSFRNLDKSQSFSYSLKPTAGAGSSLPTDFPSSAPLKYLSLSTLSSKTAQLLKQLSASGSRLMASAASPMTSLSNGASGSAAAPSPAASAFTPGMTPGTYNGIATPAASHLSSMTPAPFSIPTPSNLQQGLENHQDIQESNFEGDADAAKREDENEDDDSGDLDLWGGGGDDLSEDGETNHLELRRDNETEFQDQEQEIPGIDAMEEVIASQPQSARDQRDGTNQDEEMNESAIGSVIDGNDFEGLVTEDDFSFFDGGAFDFAHMDVDTNVNGGASSDAPDILSDSIFDDQVAHDLSGQTQKPHSGPDNPSSVLDDTATGIAFSTSASTSSTDPPSLPGFTPSSLTASSPAFANGNGMSAKTPRTPFSPYNEFNEPTIVGEGDLTNSSTRGMGSYRDRLTNDTQDSFDSVENDVNVRNGREESHKFSSPRMGENSADNSSDSKSGGGRDLGDKYQFGKFAVPLQKITQKLEADTHGTDDNDSDKANGSNRKRGRRHNLSHEGNGSLHRASWHLLGMNGMPVSVSQTRSNVSALKSSISSRFPKMPPIHRLKLTERNTLPGAGSIATSEAWKLSEPEEFGSDQAMTEESESDSSSFKDGYTSDEDSTDESSDEKELFKDRLIKASRSTLLSLLSSSSSSSESANLSSTSSSAASISPRPKSQDQLDEAVQLALKGSLWQSEDLLTTFDQIDEPRLVPASHLRDLLGTSVCRAAVDHSSRAPTRSHAELTASVVEVLEPPKILVGCQGSIVKFEHTVLRFWEKLALSPSGGQKPITAFLLQSSSVSLDPEISDWFVRVAQAYRLFGMGSHHFESPIEVAEAGSARNSDLTPLLQEAEQDEDAWKKLLSKIFQIVQPILSRGQHVVLYALQDRPTTSIYLRLQRDLRETARRSIGYLSNYLVIVTLPSTFPVEASSSTLVTSLWPRRDSWTAEPDLKTFLFGLYDSLERKVKRTTMKIIHEDPREEETMVQYPAFTLSDDLLSNANSVKFQLDRLASSSLPVPSTSSNFLNAVSSDVMSCGMLLLVAYDFSSENVATASVIDARGQGYNVHAWNKKRTMKDDISELWKFVLAFARRAHVVWRIVISSVDAVDELELQEWSRFAHQGLFEDAPALDITLSSIETNFSLAILPSFNKEPQLLPGTSGAFSKTATSTSTSMPASNQLFGAAGGSDAIAPGAVFFDASHLAFALYPSHRLLVPFRQRTSIAEDEKLQVPAEILALQSSVVVRVPRDSDSSMSCSTSLFRSASSPHSMAIHALQIFKTSSSHSAPSFSTSPDVKSSMAMDLLSRLKDVTRALNALQLLTQQRRVSTFKPPSCLSVPALEYLPWHVAVLVSMRQTFRSS